MNELSDLKDKVSKWINAEGIPLEYYTSSLFMTQGFRVFQGDFVEENGVSREIDVNAFKDYQFANAMLRLHCITECKWTKDKP